MTYLPPKLTPLKQTTAKTYPEPKKTAFNQVTTPKNKALASVPAEKTAAQKALEQLIAEQLTDRRFAPVRHESLTKSVTYVTAANGLFKVTKTPVGLFKEQLESFKTSVVGLPEMEAGVDLAIPKIPMKHLIQALSFYRDVNTKDKTEASTLFFWNHEDKVLPNLPGLSSEGRLIIYCPIQINSATLSDFSTDENVHWLRKNMALLFELHSHNTMSAFFSGTDDANENMTQFYGVWGLVTNNEPMFVFRYVAGNSKIICDPSMLFEWPQITCKSETVVKETLTLTGDTSFVDIELSSNESVRTLPTETETKERQLIHGPFKLIDYPEDWMAQHSLPKYTYVPKDYSKYPYAGSYGNAYAKRIGVGDQTQLFDYEEELPYNASHWPADDWDEDAYGETYRGKKPGNVNAGSEKEILTLDELDAIYEEIVVVSSIDQKAVSQETKNCLIDIAKEIVLLEEDIAEFEN